MSKQAKNNRTLTCSDEEIKSYSKQQLRVTEPVCYQTLQNRLIHGDIFEISKFLPKNFVDLLILDPPYNLTKNYNGNCFRKQEKKSYVNWFQTILEGLGPTLKKCATIYVCSDWKTSMVIYPILDQYFYIQNRITWERDKGRGSRTNWKNNTEDIWFCTNSKEYYFNVDAVKLKKKVIAPYREDNKAKSWKQTDKGKFRYTHPSNVWTDITIPFWSMPENTHHPTQKPEKLIAKLILASSEINSFVLDPFVGSGTSAVVAQKLNRNWCGIDINSEYLAITSKRIEKSRCEPSIQGYADGIFWERNSKP